MKPLALKPHVVFFSKPTGTWLVIDNDWETIGEGRSRLEALEAARPFVEVTDGR